MRPLFRATPGDPAGFGASTFNSLAAAAATIRPMGIRTSSSRSNKLIVHCENKTGNAVPYGGIVGIKTSEYLVDYIDDDQFREYPGFVAEVPRLLNYSDQANTRDHRLSWAVALAPIAADTIGPVCVAGLCWANVVVNDPDQLFVGPKDGETNWAHTRSAGIGRIIKLATDQGAGVPRPCLIHIEPGTPLRVEGYIETLNAATATGTTLTPQTARLRLRERRAGTWERLDEYVVVENVDDYLALPNGTYVRATSWTRNGWRIDYAACNVSPASAASTSISGG